MANDTGSDDKVVPLGTSKRAQAAELDGGDASTWTPREVVMAMLREMDAGDIDPEVVFIGFRNKPTFEGGEGNPQYVARFKSSSPDPHITIGVVFQALLESYGRVDE